MGDVEIRQVHYFIAVAEEGNFTRAAQRLSMTQPALSRAILALEKAVGATLLLRTPKGATLTAAGHAMLEEGRSLLAQAGNVTSRVRRAAERNASVTLTGPGCDAALLDRMVRSYNEADPAHPARTAVGTIDDQLGRLRSGQADIALVRAPRGRERTEQRGAAPRTDQCAGGRPAPAGGGKDPARRRSGR
ncbi:LysR family transcriptional regulator [[Kitasatospora] papulosa]|uniref:LysR family transcriptional regulator n=1 Tax=[Kitasatospora] papulosa TaxID=1464011 RepID=UPI00371AB470